MDGQSFDTLARSVSEPSSRRGLLGGFAALALGLGGAGLHDTTTARKKRKHKRKNEQKDSTTLPPSFDRCVAMIDGAPCGNYGCLVCLNEVCSPNPLNDGSCGADGTGRCSFGSCNPRPTCTGTEAMCPAGDASCCSGRCGGGACYLAVPGALCKRGEDCTTGSCIGYRCR